MPDISLSSKRFQHPCNSALGHPKTPGTCCWKSLASSIPSILSFSHKIFYFTKFNDLIKLSSTNAFNLDQDKTVLFGKKIRTRSNRIWNEEKFGCQSELWAINVSVKSISNIRSTKGKRNLNNYWRIRDLVFNRSLTDYWQKIMTLDLLHQNFIACILTSCKSPTLRKRNSHVT